MERRIIFGVLGFGLLALVIALLLPPPERQRQRQEQGQTLPWQIEATTDGSIRIFDLTLARSTVAEATAKLKGQAEISLFVSPEDHYAVEAFYDSINLAGLGAKIVLTTTLSQEALKAMFDRGTRISTLGDGSRKVTLHPDDLERVRQSAIATLTYLPKINLDAELLRKRFGEPDRRMREKDSDTVHWLYPSLGLDVALSDNKKEVLQYLPPRDFARLMAPLMEQGEALQ